MKAPASRRRALCALALCLLACAAAAGADRSAQTRAFIPCTEAEPPFDANSCSFYTQYQAQVDLIGGGSSTADLQLVGNAADPVINLIENPDGTTTCPPGVACTSLNPVETEVSVIRSPLPPGLPVILPGGAVSLGIAFPLLRYADANNGLPYAYQVYSGDPDTLGSQCAARGSIDGAVTLQDLEPPGDAEPACGVPEPPQTAAELNGTCGGLGTLAPDATAFLQDGDGKCIEMCCGTDRSVRVRQLGSPQCYEYFVGKPQVAVDFAVRVRNANTPPDGTVLSVFGTLSPNQEVLASDGSGVRARIQSLRSEIARFDTSQIFRSVETSFIIVCSDAWKDAPDESGPVADVADIDWFFMPSPYIHYYKDATAADAAVAGRHFFPVNVDHPKVYGESGDTVLRNALEYIQANFPDPADQLAQCTSLDGVLPFVPGYDTDGVLLPAVAEFDLPSFCYMWNQARLGNPNFLPPNFDVAAPNWYITNSLVPVGSTSKAPAEDLFLIYIPTPADIAAANAEETLLNALTMSIEISDAVMGYGVTSAPADFADEDPAPNCVFELPSQLDEGAPTGPGALWVTVESTLAAPVQEGQPLQDVTVTIACAAVPNSGFNNTTPDIVWSPVDPVVIPGLDFQAEQPLSYSVNATFTTDGGYTAQASPSVKLATCTLTLTYSGAAPPLSLDVPCSVGYTANDPPPPDDAPRDCGACDFGCKDWYSNPCLWILVIGAPILIAMIIAFAVVGKQHNDIRAEQIELLKRSQAKATLIEGVTDVVEQKQLAASVDHAVGS